MGWSGSSNPSTLSGRLGEIITITPETRNVLQGIEDFNTSQLVVLGLACSTSFVLGWKIAKSGTSLRRITSITDISSTNLGPKSPFLRGRVMSVSDGDTFRFLHLPTRLHSSKLSDTQKLSDITLPIRICTIDTPETPKFGKPGQPFGETARDHLKSMIMDRIVRIQLLDKDQYGRGVAEVHRPGLLFGWPKKYMDQEMLKIGLAEVYIGAGAVYGHKGKEVYLAMQDKAQRREVGMWSLQNRESAAKFKARTKSQA